MGWLAREWSAVTVRSPELDGLSRAWQMLRPHPEQSALWRCDKRFVVVEAGRRSGKTLLAKMDAVRCWLTTLDQPGWLGLLCAPTRDQAKNIFWSDLKELCPEWAIESISEQDLTITAVTGNRLRVRSMEVAKRVEGVPVDKLWCDEFADTRDDTWARTIRPLLSTEGRPGRAWLFGVPRPSTQFRELAELARDPKQRDEWAYFHWRSSTVVSQEEVESARATMDPLTFAQEYEAERVTFAGRAYYRFDRRTHACSELRYDPTRKLVLCFDFNNEPGVAAVLQELPPSERLRNLLGEKKVDASLTSVVGEVWVPRHSDSQLVARKVAQDWSHHQGTVEVYGDATGGARGTSAVTGSDWDIIFGTLKLTFGGRLRNCVLHSNPSERARVNSVNSRLRSADEVVHLQVCAKRAPHVVEDLDGTLVLKGTAGELDKKSDKSRTHLTDALGYYVHQRFPLGGGSTSEPWAP